MYSFSICKEKIVYYRVTVPFTRKQMLAEILFLYYDLFGSLN